MKKNKIDTIPVQLTTFDSNTGETITTKRLKMRYCYAEEPPIFEIMLPTKDTDIDSEQAIYVSVNKVREFLRE